VCPRALAVGSTEVVNAADRPLPVVGAVAAASGVRRKIAEPRNTSVGTSLRVPETQFGVSERASAGSSGGHLMLLLAI
jgi:hypothetical protein